MNLDSELFTFLAEHNNGSEDPDRIPPLGELAKETGVSVPKLREQLGGARSLGLVDVKPRVGIRRRRYSFAPAVTNSLLYGIARDRGRFAAFSDLRIRLETAYWHEAVSMLNGEDIRELVELVECARQELSGDPIIIPHAEHRRLHLAIFKRLDNPFVIGLLEAYWSAYEAVELNSYADLSYLKEVWACHEKIVSAIAAGDIDASLAAFVEHTKLLRNRA